MPDSFVFLLGEDRLATTLVGTGNYRHSFGGSHGREILSKGEDHGIPVRLLLDLDLNDPAVPISIPHVSQLPLFYVFDSRTADFAYRINPDDSVETFFPFVDAPGKYEVHSLLAPAKNFRIQTSSWLTVVSMRAM